MAAQLGLPQNDSSLTLSSVLYVHIMMLSLLTFCAKLWNILFLVHADTIANI